MALLAAVVFGVFSSNKGSHLQLEGEVLKARTGALADTDSVAVLDFRVRNTSDVPFVVRTLKLTLEKADGQKEEGNLVSKTDLKQLFQYNRFLGSPYNEALTMRDKVPPRGQIDRMVAARFDVPQQQLESSKGLTIWIQDMDGAQFETSYKLK